MQNIGYVLISLVQAPRDLDIYQYYEYEHLNFTVIYVSYVLVIVET